MVRSLSYWVLIDGCLLGELGTLDLVA